MEARRAAGKDSTGQLVLSAAHHGGNIVIEVSDDGAGLRRDKILAKAAKQGMQVSESMTDDEVWNLIFLPGFSTAEQVTDVSGRGVGMDVVKRNIQSMGGHVEITSHAGKGSTTRIVLPLTLAILDGMSVKVGNEIFILPLNFVMESLQPQAEDIYTVANGERVVRVRGEYLPLVALHEVFSVEDAKHGTDPGHRHHHADRRTALRDADRRTGRPAAGGREESRNELPQGARHFRRDHPRRRQRRADRGRGGTESRDAQRARRNEPRVTASSNFLLNSFHPNRLGANVAEVQSINSSVATRADDGRRDALQADAGGQEFLVFTLGAEEYGIDILKVQEIRGYDSVTRIANAPEFIKGVINLRGIIVPIVDMRIKFHLGRVEYDHQTVVIILNVAHRVVGMVVDGVSDVLTLADRPDHAGAGIRRDADDRVPDGSRHGRRPHADPDGHRKADDQPRNGADRDRSAAKRRRACT